MLKVLKKGKRRQPEADELSQFTVGEHNIDQVIAGIVLRAVAPKFLVVDLFCGAGGTSTGFEMTDGDALVIACVNHDYLAIKSHWRNYSHIAHFEEDIRTLNLAPLVKLLDHYRQLYPDAKVILWASLECTNFSKAKGGQARDADSRTLAESLYMHYNQELNEYHIGDSYLQLLNPDYLMIENVVEFMSWGPLDENGKPVSRKNGVDYMRWCNEVNALGYYNEWREMNSADHGAYTSRNRLFGCFAKHGLPIAWPDATHAKNPAKGTLFGAPLNKWKAVKDVLDFSDEGRSIFERVKPLSDKTLERIYAGLIKYVAGGHDAFMLKYNSMNQQGGYTAPSVDDPCPVVSTQNRLGVAFISKYYSGRPEGKNIPVDGPAGTVTTVDSQALVQAAFIVQRNGGEPESKVVDIDGPARTLTATAGNQELVNTLFLTSYYGNGGNTSMAEPCPTLTTKDRMAAVHPCFIMRDFTNVVLSGMEQPAGAVMPSPKMNLVTPFIMPTNYDNTPKGVDAPCPTITANRKHHYVVNPSHGGHVTSTEAPCPVIVARQDKAPLYLLIATGDDSMEIAVRVDKSDTAIMRKIKEFMVLYTIVDIKMRMLKIPELLRIQGFPAGFVLEGSQADQKKFIGNSVVPQVVMRWCLAMGERLVHHLKVA